MCLFLRLLLIVFISTQLLKEAATTTNTKVTKSTAVTAFTNTSQTAKSEMEIGSNVAQTSLPSVNEITSTQPKSPSSGFLQIPSSSQSGKTAQLVSTTLHTTTITQRFSAPSSLQISTENRAIPTRTATEMNTTSSVDATTTANSHVQNTLTSFSTSRRSQPESVLPSRPSADLNSTQSKASSYTTGVPNLTLSINSSYATSTMFFTNSSAATTQAVYFISDHSPKESSTFPVALSTTAQTSSPSVNRITPTQQKSPYSGVFKIPSSSQSRQTIKSTSTTLNATTATRRFSPSSSFQISSNNQTRPMRTATAMNTTLSVDAGTTADSHVQNTLTSFSTSRKSQPESVLQSRPSADLNSTQSKASSYITGVPNQTLSINSSYRTSLMILTNSGSATTQAVYFTSDHPIKESSSLLVAHTTTDSFTKLTSAISVSVSLNWTDWSVDSSDCQRHCSDMGGTVTASRHCYSHTVTFKESICTKYRTLTQAFKCGQPHCPISGTTLLGVSISTVVVGTLLHMLPNFFGG
nr:mucin-2-like [Pocillopora verrucosa]